jgi:DNA primase
MVLLWNTVSNAFLEYEESLTKSRLLFHRARHSRSNEVLIVEGFFDAAKVWQAGHRPVVALMGSSLSEAQTTLLHRQFRSALLMLDGDTAGQSANGSDCAAVGAGYERQCHSFKTGCAA